MFRWANEIAAVILVARQNVLVSGLNILQVKESGRLF